MVNEWKRVFVTVGSTRFDKLIQRVIDYKTLEVLSSRGCSQLVIQFGSSLRPSVDANEYNIEIIAFDYKSSILDEIKSADLVIGHSGAGTCLDVLRQHKPLLVVINDDLMSNHQKELADKLRDDRYLFYCYTNTLVDSLISFDSNQLKPFPEPNHVFADFIDSIFFSDKQKSGTDLKKDK